MTVCWAIVTQEKDKHNVQRIGVFLNLKKKSGNIGIKGIPTG